MNDWHESTLGEVCEQVGGVIQTGPFGSQLHESDYSDLGIPVVMPKDIIEGRIAIENVARVSPEHVERLSRHKLKVGDIVYGRRGDIGRQALVRVDQTGWLCGTGCLRLSFGDTVINPLFLHYYLRQESVIRWISNQAIGATLPNLNTSILKSVPVHLPPLPVQQQIAGILSAYDELIENNQRRIRILEEMARILYRERFVHFCIPGYEKHSRGTSAFSGVPQGWEAIPFETLLASMTGGDWGSDQATEMESAEVTIVRGTDFDEVAYGGQLRAPVRYIKPSSLKSRGLRPGDVIVENSINAKSRCVGTTLLVDSRVLARIGRDAVAASFCKVFRMHDPRLAPLVHLHFRRLREDARMEYYQNVAANGIGNFQAQKFAKEEHLILPKDDKLRTELIGEITMMLESISILSSKLSNLRQTRDLLLPRLLSGEVNISVPEETTNVVSLPVSSLRKPAKKASDEFVEAIVISQLVRKLSDPTHPLGRKRYNKFAYLAHRKAEDDVTQHYLKKAAGPYSPWAKYGGPEKIAKSNGYVKAGKAGVFSGLLPGENISKIDQYLSHYPVCSAVDWVVNNFRYRSNDDLELLATVDFAALDLLRIGAEATLETIRQVIATNKDWAPKLKREIFSDANIARALRDLIKLYPGTYTAVQI